MTEKAPLLLVVDDEPDLRDLIAVILEDAGYQVMTARDGNDALARVAEAMPALILLDMRMPGMNGWEFAAAFRGRHGRAAPIVVLTAARDARRLAEEIDAEGYLDKPFQIDSLLSTVRDHLAQVSQM